MYIPAARERVEIIGRPGVFFVLTVNRDVETAHLISLDDPSHVVEDVHFTDLQPAHQDVLLKPGRA